MEARTFDDRERGQVGIGTLIVFIAMVLVAAIAAGVLINTADFLQSQSEQTGEESTSQVTDHLSVGPIVGNVNANDDINQVNITVSKAPGAQDISTDNVTAQWVGPSGTYNILSDSVSGASSTFTVSALKDADNSIPVLNSPDDRFILTFDTANFGASAIGEGETVQLQLTTQSGSERTVRISVPQSLSGETAVTL